MMFTTREIEKLAAIAAFPDGVNHIARTLMICFAEENAAKENQAAAIQRAGKTLCLSLSPGQRVDYLLEDHQMHFGNDSANIVRQHLGQFITMVGKAINQDKQRVSGEKSTSIAFFGKRMF